MSLNEDHSGLLAECERSARIVQVALGAMALGSVAFGLGVYAAGDRLGLAEDTAKVIASAFLIAASLDALVLYGWERMFGPRTPDKTSS